MTDQLLLTIRESSHRLGLSESTLRKWILNKRITHCKLGRAVRIPVQALDKMIRDGYRPQQVLSNDRRIEQ